MKIYSKFDTFKEVADRLEMLASRALRGEAVADRCITESELFASFRQSAPLHLRKAAGTFFTSRQLSSRLVRFPRNSAVVLDPACGMGDLLLSHAMHMRPSKCLQETLEEWGSRLLGRELEEPLIRVARARIVLAATAHHFGGKRSAARTSKSLDSFFPELRQGDGLDLNNGIIRATDILLNPPYSRIKAPEGCSWGSGYVTAAAIFVDRWISYAKPGSRIAAILPDVLRSGSRYTLWRAMVEEHANIDSVEIAGQFDAQTQVDVFFLRLSVRQAKASQSVGNPWVTKVVGATLGDYFRVSVGPLVAYREPLTGPWYPYLDVNSATPWGHVIDPHPYRRFRGRTIMPPFIAIRRTSSPHDKRRAIATLVTGNRPVAVENHLIVLEPFDRAELTCLHACDILAEPTTTDWLNDRIRCRHLTVDSVREIPWH